MKSGVYIIINTIDKMVYVGSTDNFRRRRVAHFNLKTQHNNHLRDAIRKYGVQNFKWDILECCIPEKCVEREQYYLDKMLFAQEYIKSNGQDNRFIKLSYNQDPTASSTKGRKASEREKKLNSEKSLLKWQRPEYREKMIEARRGRYTEYHEKVRRPVLVYSKATGQFIAEYESVKATCRALFGRDRDSTLWHNLNRNSRHARGYACFYKTTNDYPKQIQIRKKPRTVKQKFVQSESIA